MGWGTVAIGVACLIAGFLFGSKAALSTFHDKFARHNAGRTEDRAAFLTTVRRELGNLLIWEDPMRFKDLYARLHAETSSYKFWKPGALQDAYDQIAKRYPNFGDFDVLGVRTYVLYPTARALLSDEDLASHYADLTRFVALLAATEADWRQYSPTSEDEVRHLDKYARSVLDTKFKLRLQRAIQDLYVWLSADDTGDRAFDRQLYSVQRVNHFAENRYGVHLKDTNEHGLYSFFVSDEGKIYHSYYRSDPTFQSEKWLDVDHALFEHFGGVRD